MQEVRCRVFAGGVDVGSMIQRINAGGLLQPQGFDAGFDAGVLM